MLNARYRMEHAKSTWGEWSRTVIRMASVCLTALKLNKNRKTKFWNKYVSRHIFRIKLHTITQRQKVLPPRFFHLWTTNTCTCFAFVFYMWYHAAGSVVSKTDFMVPKETYLSQSKYWGGWNNLCCHLKRSISNVTCDQELTQIRAAQSIPFQMCVFPRYSIKAFNPQ